MTTDPKRMEKALHDIEAWARAYPLKVFPEPDMTRVSYLLARDGMSLDAVSASCMRLCLSGVLCLVADGLGEE